MFILLFSAACVRLAVAELVLTLDSKDWTMVNENGTLSLKTNVPAYPLEVLRSQGVIGDPLYRWVAAEGGYRLLLLLVLLAHDGQLRLLVPGGCVTSLPFQAPSCMCRISTAVSLLTAHSPLIVQHVPPGSTTHTRSPWCMMCLAPTNHRP